MPWHIARSDECPADMPHAVIKNSDGSVAGCHATEAAAKKQMAALYANEKGDTMTSSTERRFTAVPVELRAKDKLRIGGYAARFSKYSDNLGGFTERVMPTAFNRSRADGWPDVLARYNHDDNMLLGTSGGNTLRLSIDDTGLVYEVDLPHSRADIAELVERGDVRKSSFAFRVLPDGDEWDLNDQGFPRRSLHNVQLVDVAPVNTPAYSDTSVGKRSVDIIGGLQSLARHMNAELEEVRKLAEADELRKFFVRTDKAGNSKPATEKLFGPAAVAQLLAKQTDPWA